MICTLRFLKRDASEYLNKNFQLHRSFGGKLNFLTPLGIQNNEKVRTSFVLKMYAMFINILYNRILFDMIWLAKEFRGRISCKVRCIECNLTSRMGQVM